MPLNKWWARQDSNLQPDRYERSALTIELQARRALDCRQGGGARTTYMAARNPAMPRSAKTGQHHDRTCPAEYIPWVTSR